MSINRPTTSLFDLASNRSHSSRRIPDRYGLAHEVGATMASRGRYWLIPVDSFCGARCARWGPVRTMFLLCTAASSRGDLASFETNVAGVLERLRADPTSLVLLQKRGAARNYARQAKMIVPPSHSTERIDAAMISSNAGGTRNREGRLGSPPRDLCGAWRPG